MFLKNPFSCNIASFISSLGTRQICKFMFLFPLARASGPRPVHTDIRVGPITTVYLKGAGLIWRLYMGAPNGRSVEAFHNQQLRWQMNRVVPDKDAFVNRSGEDRKSMIALASHLADAVIIRLTVESAVTQEQVGHRAQTGLLRPEDFNKHFLYPCRYKS